MVRLCVNNNIVILEGISHINCNASIIQLAQNTGYTVKIFEIYSDRSQIEQNLISRGDSESKIIEMNAKWKKRRLNIGKFFEIQTMSQIEIFNWTMDTIKKKTRRSQNFQQTTNFVSSKYNLNILFDQIETIMEKIKIQPTTPTEKKKWKYMCRLGRSTTRYIKNSNHRCVQHPTKKNIMINTSNVLDRKELPLWKIKLYGLSSTLLKMVNKTWAGKYDDYCVQFTCMDENSYVKKHVDANDVSSQFVVTFGNYIGGELLVYNEISEQYIPLITNRNIVQFDGRKKHYVTDVTEGKRYSIVFYKSYDRRYDSQPIFTGVKTYTQK